MYAVPEDSIRVTRENGGNSSAQSVQGSQVTGLAWLRLYASIDGKVVYHPRHRIAFSGCPFSLPSVRKMVDHAMPRKLWEHENIQSTEMHKFMQAVNARHGTQLEVKLQSRIRHIIWLHGIDSNGLFYAFRLSPSSTSIPPAIALPSTPSCSTGPTLSTRAFTPAWLMKPHRSIACLVGSQACV
jgi:hypothetical protein